MEEARDLRYKLDMAQRALSHLEEKAAGQTILEMPTALKIDLDEKRNEVDSLATRLALAEGRRPDSLPNNLPRRRDFVGRRAEIAKCMAALTPQDRGWGVLIDGMGGIGKTTLAVEAAHLAQEQAVFDAYAYASAKETWLTTEGIQQRDSALHSFGAFVRELALVLGFQDVAQANEVAERSRRLLERLRGRRALLIWDNLETLHTDEQLKIFEFLRQLPAPNKALVTSRRRVGEAAVTVRLGSLSESEATELIAEQARQMPRVGEELGRATAQERRALYQASAGNPILLQYALGLINSKGYSLSRATEFLREAGQSDDIVKFMYSHALPGLEANEKVVLSALAVQSSATVEVLQATTKLTPNEIETVLEHLISLSLVADPVEERFGLHALARQHIHRILGEEPKLDGEESESLTLDSEAGRRMMTYWVGFAQKHGGENYDSARLLQPEWSNLQDTAAHLRDATGLPKALTDRKAAVMLVELADALCREDGPLFLWGYWDESIQLGTWAYDAACALGDWANASRRAYEITLIYARREEAEPVQSWLERTNKAQQQVGNEADVPRSSDALSASVIAIRIPSARLLGWLASITGKLDDAAQRYTEALESARKIDDKLSQARVLLDLGRVLYRKNDFQQAETRYNQGHALAKEIGHKGLEAKFENALGDLALGRAPLDQLIDQLFGVVSGDHRWYTKALAGAFGIAVAMLKASSPEKQPTTDVAKAHRHYARALALANEVGLVNEVANAEWGLAETYEKEGKYREALPLAETAERTFRQLRDPKLERVLELSAKIRVKIRPSGHDASAAPAAV